MCADILLELTELIESANGQAMTGPEQARIQDALAERQLSMSLLA